MKLLLIVIAVSALCQAGPARRRFKFTKGNSGTSGRAMGDETSIDTNSKVQAGGEDTGMFAESEGAGSARGPGESSLDLESWAGFEDHYTGGAGGGGTAGGDETDIRTNSNVFIGEETGFAKSGTRGSARGRGKSFFDLESFGSLDGWGSGNAGGSAKATGEETEVDGESFVESEFGRGTLSKSENRGAAANNNGLAVLDLENFAEVEENNSGANAKVKALGNNVTGLSRSSSLHGADGETEIYSEAEGAADASGRGGMRTAAEANGNGFLFKTLSEGRGEGDVVNTGGNSKVRLTNAMSEGRSQSFASSRGLGNSYAESSASLNIGQEPPRSSVPDETSNCDTNC